MTQFKLTVGLAALLFGSACAAPGERVTVASDSAVTPSASENSSPPSTAPTTSTHSRATLIAFRDAAAAAPYWSLVDWSPPTSLPDVARHAVSARLGNVIATSVVEPRPADLVPHENVPNLYDLDVDVVLRDQEGDEHHVRVPVMATSGEGFPQGQHAAEVIRESVPIGAEVVLLRYERRVLIVGMEANDGSLVAYYESLDEALATHTRETLLAALELELDGS